jgi:hypothetical protein
MRVLSTIQKRNKLNRVYSEGEVGPGGAFHEYGIEEIRDTTEDFRNVILEIKFQKGARGSEGSVTGVLDGDLLEIVRDRLTAFQKGNFATDENEHALRHIEEALMWMNKRAEDRFEKGVLGTYRGGKDERESK